MRKFKRLRREFFKIDRVTRKYDRDTHTFTFNIAYRTATLVTPRTVAVAEAFGLGVDEERDFVIYKDFELKLSPKAILYITGDSGSGKSVLLKAIEQDLSGLSINMQNITINDNLPLVDTVGSSVEEALELLSKVGLNDAFIFIRRYPELSDGQKYRYRLAKLIEGKAQVWVCDEFLATLDRDTAKIVAYNIQKLARQLGRGLIVATTHKDLMEDLKPDVHIHKRFGKEVQVQYFDRNIFSPECSLMKEIRLEEGAKKDYYELAEFHYRGKTPPPIRKIWSLKRGEELVGVIVYSYPAVMVFGRKDYFGKPVLHQLNNLLSVISRVVVHPKYRTMGLGVKLVKETLPLSPTPYVETIAVMARYNPFFEKAGMTKVKETQPEKKILATVEALQRLGFDPIFTASHKYDLNRLKCLTPSQVETIRELFIKHPVPRYHKLVDSRKFVSTEEFEQCIKNASLNQLAHLIHVLTLLAQKKVYLVWRNPAYLEPNKPIG